MGSIKMKYVTTTIARGKLYYYFRRNGARYPLPDIKNPQFSLRYHELLAEANGGGAMQETTPGTIDWLIKRWKQRQEYSEMAESTRRGDGVYFDIISKAWGGALTYAIGRVDVEDLICQYPDQPGKTIKLLAAISKLMRYAISLELRTNNPCMGIRKPRIGEYKQWPDKLLNAALTSDDGLFRRAVALHYFTGQRTSDACRMPWSALKDDQIEVRQQKKRGKLIIIPIHETLADILTGEKFKAVTILENQMGESLKPGAFRRWCAAFCADQGVEGYSPHGLRKNAVSALMEIGCSVAEVAAITDQSLATVEHYAKARNQVKIARGTMARWSKVTNISGKSDKHLTDKK